VKVLFTIQKISKGIPGQSAFIPRDLLFIARYGFYYICAMDNCLDIYWSNCTNCDRSKASVDLVFVASNEIERAWIIPRVEITPNEMRKRWMRRKTWTILFDIGRAIYDWHGSKFATKDMVSRQQDSISLSECVWDTIGLPATICGLTCRIMYFVLDDLSSIKTKIIRFRPQKSLHVTPGRRPNGSNINLFVSDHEGV
jgi:hypothetical protein